MKQKVALVLGSGGARGIAHIGAIRELLDNVSVQFPELQWEH
jgi:predicted acylesterase/phospholipase RssA